VPGQALWRLPFPDMMRRDDTSQATKIEVCESGRQGAGRVKRCAKGNLCPIRKTNQRRRNCRLRVQTREPIYTIKEICAVPGIDMLIPAKAAGLPLD
jgi:hypothetical protein